MKFITHKEFSYQGNFPVSADLRSNGDKTYISVVFYDDRRFCYEQTFHVIELPDIGGWIYEPIEGRLYDNCIELSSFDVEFKTPNHQVDLDLLINEAIAVLTPQVERVENRQVHFDLYKIACKKSSKASDLLKCSDSWYGDDFEEVIQQVCENRTESRF